MVFFVVIAIPIIGYAFDIGDESDCPNGAIAYTSGGDWFCKDLNAYMFLEGHENITVSIAASNVYYNITGLQNITQEDFEFNVSGENCILVPYNGTFFVSSQFSFSGNPNTEYHLSLSVNGVQDDRCHTERKLGAGGDVGSASYVCLLDLVLNDTIIPVIENTGNTGDAILHNVQLIIHKVS